MGFRSTFITEDIDGHFPEWFITKWQHVVHFGKAGNDGALPLSSKWEAKHYDGFQDLETDIQKAFPWDGRLKRIILVWLHECGGITRVEISKNAIKYSEPYDWNIQDEPTHTYCYGCSDVSRFEEPEANSDSPHSL